MNRNILTEKDIKDIIRNGSMSITLPKDAIISPLAQDLIEKKGFRLNYQDIIPPSTSALNAICKSASYNIGDLSKDLILSFYYLMLKIRFFEKLVISYREKEIIPGVFVHSYIGEEAIAVGVCRSLTDKDYITSTHRGHGHLIAKGADIKKMFAEMLGKVDGYCRGKGGSMHISDIDIGILGANGIVGAGLPIACGSALVSKFEGDRNITVSFFGDGATNQGTFGESLNFAKIFSLPVLFMCENNSYAVSTPISYGCSNSELYKRALAYDIEAVSINGDNVFEVYYTCKQYIEEMRKNPRPVLIEAKTHRQLGHWVGDPQNYRSHEDTDELSDYDPIKIFIDVIKDRNDINNNDIKKIVNYVASEIKEAAVYGHDSPYPPVEESDKFYLKE